MWKWALACIQVDSLINIKSETNKQKELFTQLILNDDYFFSHPDFFLCLEKYYAQLFCAVIFKIQWFMAFYVYGKL